MKLTPQQFAERASKRAGMPIPARRIRYAIRTGRLAATNVGGVWYVDESELDHYIKSNREDRG